MWLSISRPSKWNSSHWGIHCKRSLCQKHSSHRVEANDAMCGTSVATEENNCMAHSTMCELAKKVGLESFKVQNHSWHKEPLGHHHHWSFPKLSIRSIVISRSNRKLKEKKLCGTNRVYTNWVIKLYQQLCDTNRKQRIPRSFWSPENSKSRETTIV